MVTLTFAWRISACTVANIFTVRFEQRTERVSERMPADPFRNPGSLRCRTDVILHCAVRPNRLLAVHLD